MKRLIAFATVAAAAAAVGAQPPAPKPAPGMETTPSYLAGAVFGAGSYESFRRAGTELERAYKMGFAFGGQFYHGGGRVSHVFSFRYRAGTAFNDVDRVGDYALEYAISICLASGRLCPAVRPFFGAHYDTAPGSRRSQGEVGLLGGARYKIVPTECTFSDVYLGWRGRYGSSDLLTKNRLGWKNALVLRNANTIHIAGPACAFFTFDVDFDFTDVADNTRKPTLAVGAGPAFSW
jgi:hypothetical protein